MKVKKSFAIYAYYFPDKTSYVGQTCRIKQRHYEHKCVGMISEKIQSLPSYKYKLLETAIENVQLAAERELFWYEELMRRGWKMLNRVAPGSTFFLGGKEKWTTERLRKEVSRFSSVEQWRKEGRNSYLAASKRNMIRELSSHMIPLPDKMNKILQIRVPKELRNWYQGLGFQDAKIARNKIRLFMAHLSRQTEQRELHDTVEREFS